jgi:hypothetical protein
MTKKTKGEAARTSEQVAAMIASQQRTAMAIVATPKSARAEALAAVRRDYYETIKQKGHDNETGQRWAALMVQGIEILVAEIEASGGERGGHA